MTPPARRHARPHRTAPPWCVRRGVVLCVLACLLLAPRTARSTEPQSPGEVSEAELKAGFLLAFPAYIRWPNAVLEDADDPLVILIVGDATVEKVLRDRIERAKAGRGRKRKGPRRPVEVRHLDPRHLENEVEETTADTREALAGLDTCHIVYITASVSDSAAAAVLARSAGRPVLTIEDRRSAPGPRAMIEFVREGRRMSFGIRLHLLGTASLEAHSRLVQRARIIPPDDERRSEQRPTSRPGRERHGPPRGHRPSGGGR